MFLFLDESGDLGFNFDSKKPSSHLIITILVCYDKQTVRAFETAIKHTMRRKMNDRKSGCELKGYLTTLSVKKYFFNNLLKKQGGAWELCSVILDKKKVLFKANKPINQNRIYNALAHKALSLIDFNKAGDHIQLVVDRCKSNKEREVFNAYLQTHLEALLPFDKKLYITHGLSHDFAGLQAVDMFCYGIAKKHALSEYDWYNIFKDKIISEELF